MVNYLNTKQTTKETKTKAQKKLSPTYHVEGNDMASITKTAVGKDLSNLLIVESLLKILKKSRKNNVQTSIKHKRNSQVHQMYS